jgi:hypothetical protein
MPIAILTKFLGPTNTKPARVKAYTANGQNLVIGYHSAETSNPHREAAESLRDKMGWKGDLIEGGTADGCAFVFAPPSETKRKLISLRYLESDNGNCRVYYKGDNGRLYCWQVDGYNATTFALLSCSKDGEPACPVRMECFGETETPKGDDSVDQELREYLRRSYAPNEE